ncbi:ataxin-7-like protein 1 isoform X2 [Anguilla rostrata]|uniref:ataxin-7-like protein 1 isoform X2 n=1 Tax=Anguilla rostrata TaxID=7938 RepID=UPI0030D25DEB
MHSKNQRRHGSPVVPMRDRAPLAHGSGSPSQPKPFRAPRDGAHSPFGRAPHAVYPPKGARGRPCVSVPVVSLEKMPCLGRNDGAHVRLNCTSTTSSSSSSSSSSSAAVLKPSRKPPDRVPNGRIPSGPPSAPDRRPSASPSALDRRPASSPGPSPSSLDRRPSAPPTPLDKKHQNGTKGSKPCKRTSARVFDPNKHCGVLDPESKRPCTRSLTCKTHSLTHRRAVPGRKKLFDSLLAEHKGRVKEKEKEKEAQSAREQQRGRDPGHGLPAQSHDPPSGPPTNGKTPSPSKARPVCAYVPRTPGSRGGVSQNCCPGPAPDAGPLCLGAEGGGRPSSEEDEGAVPDESERPDCHCSPRHPRPVGCCSFGSRLMGRGHYVFDRRWDRTRLALHRMVERHVNSLMWRKIPQANESPTPSPGAIPAAQAFLSPSSSGPYGIGLPLLSPPAAFVNQSEGVSMVSYSATFPPGGGGVFSIVDSSSIVAPFPALSAMSSRGARPRAKPSRPPKAPPPTSGALGVAGGGAAGGAEGGAVGGKKKKPPLSYVAPHRRNSVGAVPPLSPHPARPAFCSNGVPPLSAKTEPSPHDTDFTVPRPLSGDHALSVHSPLPFSAAYGRKRKSCGPGASIGKTAKTSGLSSIFRKGLLEPPHASLPRQPAVHR